MAALMAGVVGVMWVVAGVWSLRWERAAVVQATEPMPTVCIRGWLPKA